MFIIGKIIKLIIAVNFKCRHILDFFFLQKSKDRMQCKLSKSCWFVKYSIVINGSECLYITVGPPRMWNFDDQINTSRWSKDQINTCCWSEDQINTSPRSDDVLQCVKSLNLNKFSYYYIFCNVFCNGFFTTFWNRNYFLFEWNV